MFVPHDDVAAARRGKQKPFVLLPALVAVERLDPQQRALTIGERAGKSIDHAERVLAFGHAELIERCEKHEPVGGQAEAVAIAR